MEDSSKLGIRDDPTAVFGPFRYEFAAGRLVRDGVEIPLPPRAHAVLRVLLGRAGTLVDKRTLLASAWLETSVTEGSLSEAIRLVRRALLDHGGPDAYVQTVPRRGYRFAAPVRWESRQTTPAAPPRAARRAWRLAAAAAGGLAVLTATAWWALTGRVDPAGPRARFTLNLEDLGRLDLKGHPSVAVSRDGTRLALVLERDGVRRIAVRWLDGGAAGPIPGTEGAVAPFFSPDGRSVAFFADGRLQSVVIETGETAGIAPAPDPHGGVWTPDGAVVFASAGRLLRIDRGGRGEPRELASRGDWLWRWPDVLADGRVIGTRWRGSLETSDVAVIDRAGRAAPFIGRASHARAAGGHDVYFTREGRVFSAPAAAPRASPAAIVDRVATDPFTGAAQFAASAAGVLVYASGEPEAVARRELHWLGDDGEAAVAFGPARVKSARLAPDAERLALTLADGAATDVWIAGPEPRRLRRLSDDGRSTGGVWAPDGRHVAFARVSEGRFVAMVAPAGGGPARVLRSARESTFPYSWGPSGLVIAAETYREATGWDVDVVQVDHDARPIGARALLGGAADERSPRFSPDGRWIAYQSNASGRWEVYVAAAGGGPPHRVSRDGGESPIWQDDSRLLYTTEGLLWSVDVAISAGVPRAAAVRPLLRLEDRILADASGGRLLALARAPGEAGPGLHVVLGARRQGEGSRSRAERSNR